MSQHYYYANTKFTISTKLINQAKLRQTTNKYTTSKLKQHKQPSNKQAKTTKNKQVTYPQPVNKPPNVSNKQNLK